MSTVPGYRGFRDLESWKKGRELRMKVSIMVKTFPVHKRYRLAAQMLNASRSITNNITEGYGRFTYTDTKHFFIQARGSVTESIDHLTIALDECYITEAVFQQLEELCEEVFRLINGYINYLDKHKRQDQTLIPIPNS